MIEKFDRGLTLECERFLVVAMVSRVVGKEQKHGDTYMNDIMHWIGAFAPARSGEAANQIPWMAIESYDRVILPRTTNSFMI